MSLRVVLKPQPATNPPLNEILPAAPQNGVLSRSCFILLLCPLMLGVEPLKQTTVLLSSTSALRADGVGMREREGTRCCWNELLNVGSQHGPGRRFLLCAAGGSLPSAIFQLICQEFHVHLTCEFCKTGCSRISQVRVTSFLLEAVCELWLEELPVCRCCFSFLG